MQPVARLTALVVLLALPGCGAAPAVSNPGTVAVSDPPWPMCSERFVPGRVIDSPADRQSFGCVNDKGTVVVNGSYRCVDDRLLYSVWGGNGAPQGWGFTGDVYHRSENVAGDPGYGAAVRQCQGIR